MRVKAAQLKDLGRASPSTSCALHAAAEDGAVEDVEGGEQRGRAVALVVMRHGAGAALLHRQAGLGGDFSSTDNTTACAGGST